MSENAITRRSFLAGSAGTVALAAGSGFISFNAWERAYAGEVKGSARTTTVHSLCDACPEKCGFTAYVVEGRLTKLIGDESHPHSKGKLCARGYGYSQLAYSKDRLTTPLKRNAKGTFEAVSWDQAIAEISEKVKDILGSAGPEAVALVYDSGLSSKVYSEWFMQALGSSNLFSHSALRNISRKAGFSQVIGYEEFSPDVENAKAVMFLGTSFADDARPGFVDQVRRARERGAYLVSVSARCSNDLVYADEWVPVNPGTELAFVLALSHVVIKEGRHAAGYIKDQADGFEQWAKKIEEYTPEWAEQITGVPSQDIRRLARSLSDAAPAACIYPGPEGAIGYAYQNSGETARAIALFNTLLGCWNQKGGALILPDIAPKLDLKASSDATDKPAKNDPLGLSEFPLGVRADGVSPYLVQGAEEHDLKALFFCGSNLGAELPDISRQSAAFSGLDLCVAIDTQMSETAAMAHYVLPDTTYLERLEFPDFFKGKIPGVSLRDQVIDKIHPDTRPVDEIFTGLAHAIGVGDDFSDSKEDLINKALGSVGLDLDGLRHSGTVSLVDKTFVYATAPKWNTPTGKIQFESEAAQKAGLSAGPTWVEPLVTPSGNDLRLISEGQPIHYHTKTTNIDDLMQITKDYALTRAWLNYEVAEQLGIKDGDEIEIASENKKARCQAKVTKRIVPGALYLPNHYGGSAAEEKTAYEVGLRPMDFVPFHIEPAYGSIMAWEALVSIRKVGA